ncbi:1111_t:CDS:2 [Dentiscutata erythropus]|uniref:1111_t:CDS:1 n=1 Tax=Dentiscutata erythropus TaxID=1348616 RepID=A0A9N8VCX5_9GLOM|nr:1111_t:CDS:2 [Dentiscutata erythropus]
MSANSDDEICAGCDESLCRTCNAKRLKEEKWTSENDVIDKFIRQIQLEAPSPDKLLEWVPFSDISKIKFLAKGGYGCVYKAVWELGPIKYYDSDTQNWHRAGKTDVVLKCIKSLNKDSITNDFFEEIKAQITSFEDFSNIIRYKTPKIIVDLIKRCWRENPVDRPTAINLVDELQRCRQDDHEIWTEIESIEEKMNFGIPQNEPCLDYNTSEIYASKTINVSKESVSSFSKLTIEIPSEPDS